MSRELWPVWWIHLWKQLVLSYPVFRKKKLLRINKNLTIIINIYLNQNFHVLLVRNFSLKIRHLRKVGFHSFVQRHLALQFKFGETQPPKRTSVIRGGSRISFRRGCTRLLLLTSTPINQFFFFFLQNTSCIRKLQVISGGGGAHPLHPPPRSAPGNCQFDSCCPCRIQTLR